MSGSTASNDAMKYLNDLLISSSSLSSIISTNQIDHLLQLLNNDIVQLPFPQFKSYCREIIDHIPRSCLTYFLSELDHIHTTEENLRKFTLFLIQMERPIFQLHGIQLFIQLQDPDLIPLITPFLFSPYPPLRHTTKRAILLFPSVIEPILESFLQDRNLSRQEIAMELLQKVNPKNLRLGVRLLQSDDFLLRIQGLEILSRTNNRKWIEKIIPLLYDPDIAVQKTAIESLAHFGGRQVRKILSQKLLDETHAPLRDIIQSVLDSS